MSLQKPLEASGKRHADARLALLRRALATDRREGIRAAAAILAERRDAAKHTKRR